MEKMLKKLLMLLMKISYPPHLKSKSWRAYPLVFKFKFKQFKFLHWGSTNETGNWLLRTDQETKSVDLQHAEEIGETEDLR